MESDKLPNEWRMATLAEIARQDGYGLVDGPFGSNLPASTYVPSGIPVIRGSNLSLGNTRFRDDEFVFVSDETAKRLSRSLCSINDIIFTKKGTLGQIGIIPTQSRYPTFLLSSNQMKLSVDQKIANPQFVYYYISSPASRAKIIRDSEATGVPKTNLAYLRTFPILLPPLCEQHSIAHILSTLDDKIDLNQRMNATLEGIAQALFKSWFVDFDPVKAKAGGGKPEGMDEAIAALFPSAFTESIAGPIPEGWAISEIGKEVEVVGGSTPSTQEAAYWEDGRFYWATPKDLSKLKSPILLDTERKITELGVNQISSGQLPIDTVLLSSRAPVGYIAIAKVPVSINQGFIAMKCTKKLSPYYVINWTYSALEEIKARATGTTFAEISKSVFRPIKVIVPNESIIQRFNDITKPIYDRIVTNERSISSLINTRDLLLPRLISGKLRVGEISETVKALAS
jgi:type I restriction enzyme S subunit